MKKFDPNVPLTLEQVRKTIILPEAVKQDKVILLQDNAAKRFESALRQTHPKSNIVLVGEVGSGKELMINTLGKEYLKSNPAPEDIVTYLDFDDNHGGFLRLPRELSQKFVEEHNKSIEDVIRSLADPMRGNILGEKLASKRFHYIKESIAKQSEFRNKYPFSLRMGGNEKGGSKILLGIEEDYDETNSNIQDKREDIKKIGLELSDAILEEYDELDFPDDMYVAETFAAGVTCKLLEYSDARYKSNSRLHSLLEPLKPLKKSFGVLDSEVKRLSQEKATFEANAVAASTPAEKETAQAKFAEIDTALTKASEEMKTLKAQLDAGKEAIKTDAEYACLKADAVKLYKKFSDAK